jgi:hypothetical protein
MAETKTIELDIKSNLGSLKSQLREAQNEVNFLSEKFGATSTEAINAAKAAATLKDKIGDAKALTDAFNPDAKFKSLTSSIGGAAGGFSAFQGAMGLVGAESKNVEAALLKVQSAMALSQGLQQLGEARDSFKQLGAVAKNVFSGIKGAIAATGIGLLLVGLGALYANWDKIKDSLGGVTAKQAELNRLSNQHLLQEQLKYDRLKDQDNALRLQGVSERDILKAKILQTGEIIKAGIQQVEMARKFRDEQIKTAQKNKEMLISVIDFIQIPLSLILKSADAILNTFGKKSTLNKDLKDFQDREASLIFDPKDIKDKANKAINEQITANQKLLAEQQAMQVQVLNMDKEAALQRKQIRDDAISLKQTEEDEARKKELEAEAQNEANEEEAAASLFKDEQDKAKKEQARIDKIKKDEQDIANFKLETAAFVLEQERINELKAIEDRKKLQKQKIQMVVESLSILQDATTLFTAKNDKDARTQFKINKALSLSSAIVNTALAVTGALTAGGNPIKLATGIQFVEAGIAAASGGVAIAKIAATQYGGSSGGGGGNSLNSSPSPASNVTSPITPNFNIVGANGQNQLNGLNQPIQAFVVSGQVTTQQQLDRNKLRNATF